MIIIRKYRVYYVLLLLRFLWFDYYLLGVKDNIKMLVILRYTYYSY